MRNNVLRCILRRKGTPMTPEEVEQMIRTNASEASLLRYQEAIGKEMSGSLAARVDEYASGFARGDLSQIPEHSGVVDVLKEVATIIRTSKFPSSPISLRRSDRAQHASE